MHPDLGSDGVRRRPEPLGQHLSTEEPVPGVASRTADVGLGTVGLEREQVREVDVLDAHDAAIMAPRRPRPRRAVPHPLATLVR